MPLYRIAVFGEPRAPWRQTEREAMADAKRLKLASYDQEAREWFIPVPAEMLVEPDPLFVGVPYMGKAK